MKWELGLEGLAGAGLWEAPYVTAEDWPFSRGPQGAGPAVQREDGPSLTAGATACAQKLQSQPVPAAPVQGGSWPRDAPLPTQAAAVCFPDPAQEPLCMPEGLSACAKGRKGTHSTQDPGISRKSCQLLPNSFPQRGRWLQLSKDQGGPGEPAGGRGAGRLAEHSGGTAGEDQGPGSPARAHS